MLSPSSKITNPEHTCQFKLVKDPQSNRVNDLLINNTIPITLYDNLLTFRDTDKKLELKGNLLKMITNNNYKTDLAILSNKKLMLEFANEMYFDEKDLGNKITKDKTLIKLLKPPDIMVSASGVSSSLKQKCFSKPIETKTRFL